MTQSLIKKIARCKNNRTNEYNTMPIIRIKWDRGGPDNLFFLILEHKTKNTIHVTVQCTPYIPYVRCFMC